MQFARKPKPFQKVKAHATCRGRNDKATKWSPSDKKSETLLAIINTSNNNSNNNKNNNNNNM